MAQYSNDDLASFAKLGIYLNDKGEVIENPYHKDFSNEENATLIQNGIKPVYRSPSLGEQLSGAWTGVKAGAVNGLGGLENAAGVFLGEQGLADRAQINFDQGREIQEQLPETVKQRLSQDGFNGTKLIQGAANLAPQLGAAVGSEILTGGMATPLVISGLSAAAAGQTSADTFSRVYQDAINKGLSTEEATKLATDSSKDNLKQSFLLNSAVNAASMGVGKAVGGMVNGGAKGAVAAIGADLPINVVGTLGQEYVDSSTQNRDYNLKQAGENAINNAILGSSLAGFGGFQAGRQVADLANNTRTKSFQDTPESSPINYFERSAVMREEAANKRLAFLQNQEGNTGKEFKVFPTQNGKFIVGEVVKETPKTETTTPEATQTGEIAASVAKEQVEQQVDSLMNNNSPLEAAVTAGKADDASVVAREIAEKSVDNVQQPIENTIENVVRTEEPVIEQPKKQVDNVEEDTNTYHDPAASLKEIRSDKSDPRYKIGKGENYQLKFNNDLDKAIYIATKSEKSKNLTESNNHDNILQFVKDKTNLNDEQIRNIGQDIRSELKNRYKNNTDPKTLSLEDVNYTKNNTSISLENGVNRFDYAKNLKLENNKKTNPIDLPREKVSEIVDTANSYNQKLTEDVIKNNTLSPKTKLEILDSVSKGLVKQENLKELLEHPTADNFDLVNKVHREIDSDEIPFVSKEKNKSVDSLQDNISRLDDGRVEITSTVRRPGNPELLQVQDFLPELNLKSKDKLTLEREQDNKDKHAIKIMQNGKKLGYVSDELAKQLSKYLDDGQLTNLEVKAAYEHIPNAKFNEHNIPKSKKTYRTNPTTGRTEVYRPIIKIIADEKIKGFTYDTENVKSKTSKVENPATKEIKAKDEPFNLSQKDKYREELSQEVNRVAEVLHDLVSEKLGSNKINLKLALTTEMGESRSTVAREIAESYGEKASNYLGFYSRDENGEPIVYVNLNRINKAIKDSRSSMYGMSLEDAATFTMTHELMGHYAIDTFFKNRNEADKYLNNIYINSKIVKEIADFKRKNATYSDENIASLTEEVLSDLVGNRVEYFDKDGNVKSLTLDKFAKEYSNNKNFLTEVLDFIKRTINDLVGRDLFSTTRDELDKLNNIKEQLEFMGESLRESPEIRYGQDYIDGKIGKADSFNRATTIRAMSDPTATYEYDYRAKFSERLKDAFKLGKDFDLLGYSGIANKNKSIKVGYDLAGHFRNDNQKFSAILQKQLDSLFVKNALGLKVGLNIKEKNNIGQLFVEAAKNKKAFTEAELQAKGISQKEINHYLTYEKAIRNQESWLANSNMLKEIIKDGLIKADTDEYFRLTDVTKFTPENYYKEVMTIAARTLKGDELAKKSLNVKHILNSYNKNTTEAGIPRLVNGDYYITVRNEDGTLRDLKQFTSEPERYRVLQQLERRYGDKFKIEKGDIADGDLLNKESLINKILDEANKNGVPVNIEKFLGKYVNQSSKKISANMHLTMMNSYIKELGKDIKTTSEAASLRELKKAVERNNEDGIINKLKSVNTLALIGGSVASSVTNLTSIPMAVIPEISSHVGLTKATSIVTKAIGFASKETFVRNKDEKLAESIVKSFGKEFSGKEDLIKNTLTRLIDDGILSEQNATEIRRMNSGIDISNGQQIAEKLGQGWMLAFSEIERVNRQTTAISALLAAMETATIPKTEKTLYGFVRDSIYKTQGNYGIEARPTWARGPIGGLLWQFKTFPATQIQNFLRLMKGNAQAKRAGLLMGAGWLLASGVQGIPFIQDAEELIDSIGRLFGYDTSSAEWIEKMLRDAGLGNEVARRAMYGTLDGNLQIGNRVSSGKMLPFTDLFNPTNKDTAGTILEGFGPTGSIAKGAVKVVNNLSEGNYVGAVENGPITGLKNLSQAITGYATGELRDSKGNKTIDADVLTSTTKLLGFQPAKETVEKRRQQQIKSTVDYIARQQTLINKTLAESMARKDPELRQKAIDMVKEWNNNHEVTERVKLDYKSAGQQAKQMKAGLENSFNNRLSKAGKALNRDDLKQRQ